MESKIPAAVDVVVIGAGPVGLTASLLLSHLDIPHLLVEERTAPTDHPQAHFISGRSMEIFRELGLERAIRDAGAPLAEWRHYVYSTNLVDLPRFSNGDRTGSGALLGAVDHFPEGPDRLISPTWECHLPQHVLVGLLRDAAVGHPHCRLVEGARAEVQEASDHAQVSLWDAASDRRQTVRCRYAVCADGARSNCRKSLGISRRQKTPMLQNLLNVHFFSSELADLLRQRIMGMLYFVYSPAGIGVFVNHSLERGEFVLQNPFFPPYEDAAAFTPTICADIINRLVGAPVAPSINSVRPWRLGAWVADTFHSRSGRCFLAGDAAHQFLPAGGFGMNCGIGDVHNLAWKLAGAVRDVDGGRSGRARDLLHTYDTERRPVAEQFLKISRQNFDKTLAVASAIGLDWDAARWLDRLVRILPAPQGLRNRVFTGAMRLGLRQVNLLNGGNPIGYLRRKDLDTIFANPAKTLQMRFPREDLGVAYHHGWLETKGGTETRKSVSSAPYAPQVAVGARLPHVWLSPMGAEADARISSLDLPVIAARKRGEPVHVLLEIGAAPETAPVDRLDDRFGPLVRIRIDRAGSGRNDGDYLLAADAPTAFPGNRALLIRPDGHVAWIWDGNTAKT